jgi:hypothetical protein
MTKNETLQYNVKIDTILKNFLVLKASNTFITNENLHAHLLKYNVILTATTVGCYFKRNGCRSGRKIIESRDHRGWFDVILIDNSGFLK